MRDTNHARDPLETHRLLIIALWEWHRRDHALGRSWTLLRRSVYVPFTLSGPIAYNQYFVINFNRLDAAPSIY